MKIDPHKAFGQRECPGCATEVAANENRCPICGYEFPTAGRTWRITIWLVAILMLLLLLSAWW